ncbi:hypothetical protein FRB99_001022, partial [Tulasnella sp. 403]
MIVLTFALYDVSEFPIVLLDVPLDANVAKIKERLAGEIEKEGTEGFKSFRLWKLKCPRKTIDLPIENIRPSDLNRREPTDVAEWMDPTYLVSDYFTEQPDYRGKVLILVTEVNQTLGKRRDIEPTIVECLKRQRLTLHSPSEVGKSPNYYVLQTSEENKILCDRPSQDMGIAPICLLYPGFRNFRDNVDGSDPCLLPSASEQICLQESVDDLIIEVAASSSQPERWDKVHSVIRRIFGEGDNDRYVDIIGSNTARSRTQPDGPSTTGTADVICLCKPEVGGGDGPFVEAVAYATRMHQTMAAKDDYRELYNTWRVPTLLIMIIGPMIRFYDLVVVGQLRVLPLDHPFLLTFDQTLCEKLYKAFSAARLLRERIRKDTEDRLALVRSGNIGIRTLNPKTTARLPCVDSIPRISDSGTSLNELLTFQLVERYHSQLDCFLYRAQELEGGPQFFVKFTKRYSKELHIHCAQTGNAPKLLGFGSVPGG